MNDRAEESEVAVVSSLYVGRVDLSIESFPTYARIPAFCMASARIRLDGNVNTIRTGDRSFEVGTLCILLDSTEKNNCASSILNQSAGQRLIDLSR